MSNERINLKYYENKYTFETPIDPNWNGAPWTTADLKVILDELRRCYEEIDKLRKQPVSISCEHCSHVYEEEYLHEMLEMGPNGECVMCLEEASE